MVLCEAMCLCNEWNGCELAIVKYSPNQRVQELNEPLSKEDEE